MKPGRRVLLILAVLAVLAIAVVLVCSREKEPEYQGRKLSEWLGRDMKANGDTLEAVRAMGTNVLPYLVKWLDYARPRWQYKLMEIGRKCSPRLRDRFYGINDRKVERMNNAIWAFDNLGVEGTPAIPGLLRLMRGGSTNVAATAAYVLGGVGENAVPILLDVLTNRQAYPRVPTGTLGTTIRRPLTNGILLVPALVAYLTNEDAELRGNAATMLGELRAEPGIAVPGLIGIVGDKNRNARYRTIVALGKFRGDAQAAVASLLAVLKDSDNTLRNAAADTLRDIAPNVLTNGVSRH